MASHAEALQRGDIGVFVIGFDDLQTLGDMKTRLSSPFIFLRDASRAGYRTLGLGRAGFLRTYLHPEVLRPYARLALEGEFPKLRRQQDRRQLGGDFVVRRNGEVVFSHPQRGPEDRASVGAIVEAVRSAQKPEKR